MLWLGGEHTNLLKNGMWHFEPNVSYKSQMDVNLFTFILTSTKFVHSCIIQTKSNKFKQSQFLKIS